MYKIPSIVYCFLESTASRIIILCSDDPSRRYDVGLAFIKGCIVHKERWEIRWTCYWWASREGNKASETLIILVDVCFCPLVRNDEKLVVIGNVELLKLIYDCRCDGDGLRWHEVCPIEDVNININIIFTNDKKLMIVCYHNVRYLRNCAWDCLMECIGGPIIEMDVHFSTFLPVNQPKMIISQCSTKGLWSIAIIRYCLKEFEQMVVWVVCVYTDIAILVNNHDPLSICSHIDFHWILSVVE